MPSEFVIIGERTQSVSDKKIAIHTHARTHDVFNAALFSVDR